MAGSLPTQDTIPVANPQDIYNLHAIPGHAVNFITSIGLTPPAPSDFDGQLPAKLNVLEGWQLTELLNQCSQRKAYIQHKLAEVEAERLTSKAVLEGIRARIRMGLRAEQIQGRKMTGPDKDDFVTNSDEVQKAQFYYILAESKYAMLRNLSDSAQLSWDTVSRHITQLGQSMYNNRREHNINAIPTLPSNDAYRGPPRAGNPLFKRPGDTQ